MSDYSGYTQNINQKADEDNLFHLNLDTRKDDLQAMFSDVKFVCVGGSPGRMRKYADYLRAELDCDDQGTELKDYTGTGDRFVVYKVKNILLASHGIGIPSMAILLHEMFKLLTHAKCTDVSIFRLGTSGGLGLEPGTVVVTTEAVNPEAKPVFEQFILGERSERPTQLDDKLVAELLDCTKDLNDFKVVPGKTMAADDFYEAQGRIDGAICNYTVDDKLRFLKKLHDNGVRNIEMECTGFAALTKSVNIRGAILCVTLLNRLIDDQIQVAPVQLHEMEMRPIKVMACYIKTTTQWSRENNN